MTLNLVTKIAMIMDTFKKLHTRKVPQHSANDTCHLLLLLVLETGKDLETGCLIGHIVLLLVLLK